MPGWAWFVLGLAVGAAGYLVIGNLAAWRRQTPAETPRAYIAGGPTRLVNFKSEDEVDGEPIGPVFITDEADPDFLHELGWMKLSDARELARGLGHRFAEDS